MKLYNIVIDNDVEIYLQGPYRTKALRLKAAQSHRNNHGDSDGIHWLSVSDSGVRVGDYSNAALEVDNDNN